MSYESIAELVHNLVKNPESLSRENEFPSAELKTNEFAIIRNVFSKCELSGDALTVSVLPQYMWG